MNCNSVVIMRICTLMFKIHEGNVLTCISDLFQVNINYHEHKTRNKTQLQDKIGKDEKIRTIHSLFMKYTFGIICLTI